MFFTLGKMTARRRMGVFLKELSERMAKSGYSAKEFKLCMSRTDIANYLRLAAETVSRVLKRFQEDGLLQVERREVELTDLSRLEALARNVLRT